MPVDTRNKRSSAILPRLSWRGQLPAPDGSIVAGDRQHTAYDYAGILAAAPPLGPISRFVELGIRILISLGVHI